MRHEPTPVVRLAWAVALAESGRLEVGLDILAALKAELPGYQPFHAAVAELSARAGRSDEAAEAYRQAIALTSNAADIAFLERRLANLEPPAASSLPGSGSPLP